MIDQAPDLDAEPRREEPQRAQRWQRMALLDGRNESPRQRIGQLGLRHSDREATLANPTSDLEGRLRSGADPELFSNT